MSSPLRPTDDEARKAAREILSGATHAALAYVAPDDGGPMVSRIAVALTEGGTPYTLISDLSDHTIALHKNPAAAVLFGEPGERGDLLNHPRLSVRCIARFIERRSDAHTHLRGAWLSRHPKAKLYIDFADFNFAMLEPTSAFLNGGFGKAYRLSPQDLR